MICWSPASPCGDIFFPQSDQQSSVFSIYWHLVVTPAQPGLSVQSLLFCHVLVFGFGFVDLLLPLLVHFLLKVLLFPKNNTVMQNKNTGPACVCCMLNKVLLLADVSELFELGTLALLCYTGQLLNQLHEERQKHGGDWERQVWFACYSEIFSFQLHLLRFVIVMTQHSDPGRTTSSIVHFVLCLNEPSWHQSWAYCAGVLEQQSFIFPRHTKEHVHRQHSHGCHVFVCLIWLVCVCLPKLWDSSLSIQSSRSLCEHICVCLLCCYKQHACLYKLCLFDDVCEGTLTIPTGFMNSGEVNKRKWLTENVALDTRTANPAPPPFPPVTCVVNL